LSLTAPELAMLVGRSYHWLAQRRARARARLLVDGAKSAALDPDCELSAAEYRHRLAEDDADARTYFPVHSMGAHVAHTEADALNIAIACEAEALELDFERGAAMAVKTDAAARALAGEPDVCAWAAVAGGRVAYGCGTLAEAVAWLQGATGSAVIVGVSDVLARLRDRAHEHGLAAKLGWTDAKEAA
jgi:hypothetical protein